MMRSGVCAASPSWQEVPITSKPSRARSAPASAATRCTSARARCPIDAGQCHPGCAHRGSGHALASRSGWRLRWLGLQCLQDRGQRQPARACQGPSGEVHRPHICGAWRCSGPIPPMRPTRGAGPAVRHPNAVALFDRHGQLQAVQRVQVQARVRTKQHLIRRSSTGRLLGVDRVEQQGLDLIEKGGVHRLRGRRCRVFRLCILWAYSTLTIWLDFPRTHAMARPPARRLFA